MKGVGEGGSLIQNVAVFMVGEPQLGKEGLSFPSEALYLQRPLYIQTHSYLNVYCQDLVHLTRDHQSHSSF